MFCKHCGKNIYDLENCPFCENGEKVENDEPQSLSHTDDKSELEAAPKEETAQNKNVFDENSVENKEISFYEKLCEKNKAFKFLNSFQKFAGLAMLGALLISFLYAWITIRNEGFERVLVLGFATAIPYMFHLVLLIKLIKYIMLIIFTVQMKKKNPPNNLLFKGVCPQGKVELLGSTDIIDITWQGIAIKYYKAPFVLSVFQDIIDCINQFMICYIATHYIFNSDFQNWVTLSSVLQVINEMKVALLIVIALWVAEIIIKQVRKKMHKKLENRYKANELK